MPCDYCPSQRLIISSVNIKILVPRSNAPTSLIVGGALTGKSIIYTYTSSSSSSSGLSSFGAVGDHLASSGSAISPGTAPAMESRNPSARFERGGMTANSRTRSPLADLVLNSIPDEEPYHLLAFGQVGPLKQPFTPQLVKPSDLSTLIRRRRSFSDLKEALQPRQSSVGAELAAPKSQVSASVKGLRPEDVQTLGEYSLVHPDEVSSNEATGPPIWSRKGLPFAKNGRDDRLDPETFSLPFGVGRSPCCV